MIDTWYTCAPIPDYSDDSGVISQPLELANGIKIESVPDWIKTDQALEHLSWSRRNVIQKHLLFGFTIEYKAKSLGDPDLDWNGVQPRSLQEKAEELIQLANLALWISKPSQLSYDDTLHFDRLGDPTSLRHARSGFGLVPHPKDIETELTFDDFQQAKIIHTVLCELSRNSTLWTAIRLLWKALADRMWESRFLLMWVVMEAIFGPTDPRETTYRLSQRVAFFLGENRKEIINMFRITKKSYSWRSKIVHGLRLIKLSDDESIRISYDLQEIMRKAILAILQNKELVVEIDGKRREQFLDGLVFNRIP